VPARQLVNNKPPPAPQRFGEARRATAVQPPDGVTAAPAEPAFGHDFGRMRVHTPEVPVAPGIVQRAAAFEGCEPPGAPAGSLNVTSEVVAVVANTVNAIDKTVAILSQSPLPPAATAALREFFGASGPGRAAGIAANLGSVARQLKNDTFTCAYPGSPAYQQECNKPGEIPAIAVAHQETPEQAGGILLCMNRALPADYGGASGTVVHEGAHRAPFHAADYGYFGFGCTPTRATRAISDEQLRYNADSYGCLVERLALGVVPFTFTGPLPPEP